ncbi:ACP S-malonyltransferase [Saccharopolyspora sp. MS10]|uniref:ACP S-malonyltransferase n=1 Tax=Saccharopolyspora sp. MS10 TaxID=3385973 RepID=UPI00399F2190
MRGGTAFLFAGQGSQYHQMGRWYYDHDQVFRRTMHELDEVVQHQRGDSVLAGLYAPERSPARPLTDFRLSHPGIFMVEFAAAEMLRARGCEPEVVLGASLGEIVAAAVAGAVDPADCLSSMLRQVELFETRCPRGGMLAVLDGTESLAELPLGDAEVAAVNSPSNVVLAGPAEDLDRLAAELTGRGVLHQRLPVPFPFHSALLEPVRAEFTELIRGLPLRPPRIPVISATTGDFVGAPDPEHLWQVLRAPFDLPRALERVRSDGARVLLDLGPAGSLANLVRALPGAPTALPLLSPYARDEVLFEAVLAALRPAPAVPRARPRHPEPQDEAEVRTVTPEQSEVDEHAREPLSVYVFPGQGAQRKGMGRELFDRFGELTALADEVLGYSVRELCVEDPQRRLRSTEFTQPALYVVNALSYLAAVQEGDRLPDYVLGHSLGEYDALFAAGAFDFATGLRLVRERGRLMSRATGGRMTAVSGIGADRLAALLRENGLTGIDLANLNTPTQTVLAGPAEELDRVPPLCAAEGARCAPLNVSAPFHSRYMADAAAEFADVLAGTSFATPKIPVIANVDARPYAAGEVADTLRRQIESPVRWEESIRRLLGLGELRVRELGPGQVLTKLIAKIQSEPPPPTGSTGAPVRADDVPRPARPAPAAAGSAPELGSAAFRRAHGTRLAYAAGGMHEGIGSVELVARMARAGLLSFLGTTGLPVERVDAALARLRAELPADAPFGLNLTHDPYDEQAERDLVELLLRHEVRCAEASSYVELTAELVRYRLRGSRVLPDGSVRAPNRVLAKITRPEQARAFLLPAPAELVDRLVTRGELSAEEAAAGRRLAVAEDVCVVGDCADHTDLGVLSALLPTVLRLHDELAARDPVAGAVRIGAAGGIGTPESAAAAFVLGADFVLTGSINLATAESGLGEAVKDLLTTADVHDTAHAPFGDLFELGARARVLKRGTLFAARANRLYDLWRHHGSWDEVPAEVRARVERQFLGATFDEIRARAGDGAGADEKRRMALVFRWYCRRARRLAVEGTPEHEADYQISCGPALGAANRWLRGTPQQRWQDRHVDDLARRLMSGAAEIVSGLRRGTSAAATVVPAVAGREEVAV